MCIKAYIQTHGCRSIGNALLRPFSPSDVWPSATLARTKRTNYAYTELATDLHPTQTHTHIHTRACARTLTSNVGGGDTVHISRALYGGGGACDASTHTYTNKGAIDTSAGWGDGGAVRSRSSSLPMLARCALAPCGSRMLAAGDEATATVLWCDTSVFVCARKRGGEGGWRAAGREAVSSPSTLRKRRCKGEGQRGRDRRAVPRDQQTLRGWIITIISSWRRYCGVGGEAASDNRAVTIT